MKMTKKDDNSKWHDLQVVRYYINEGKVHGKKYKYLPDLISSNDDRAFYIALDELNRLGNMNSRRTKENIINTLLDWYESKSEGL